MRLLERGASSWIKTSSHQLVGGKTDCAEGKRIEDKETLGRHDVISRSTLGGKHSYGIVLNVICLEAGNSPCLNGNSADDLLFCIWF